MVKDENKVETPFEEKRPVQNFDIPKGQSIEQMIASAVAQAEARIKAQSLKGQTNSIQLGVTVKDLDVREGSEIKDKKTGEVLVDTVTGDVKRYSNKYYATFSFDGGILTQEIKSSNFAKLEQNKKYFATGYYGLVSNFGKDELAPIFTDFEDLSA